MDKDLHQSRQCEDTVRVHGIDDQTTEHTNKNTTGRPSTKIRVEQLRRDQEASKRLREEAYEQRRLAQLHQRPASEQFDQAQRVANGNRGRTQQRPQGPTPTQQLRQQTAQQRVVRETQQRQQAQAKQHPQGHPVHQPVMQKKQQEPPRHAQQAQTTLHQATESQREQSTQHQQMPDEKLALAQQKAEKRKEKRALRKKEAKAVAGELAHNERLKKAGKRGLGCLFYIILFFVVIGIAFATLWAVRAHQAPTPIENIPVEQQAAVAQEREKSNVYILLAGTDQREDEASRSDTIIYAAVRPVDRKVEMVSIPRDTLVNIPEVGEGKVNSALAYGGMELLSETISGLVDNPVDHTVLVNFQSFAKIIDAMGGITIDVPEKMYLPEEGIDLEAGEQKLNGEDALAFVRWRGDGLGDIGRMERQSQFMQAVMDKMRHLPPWRWATTLWAVSHEIDTDLTTFDLLSLAWKFIGMDSGALEYQSFELNPTYIDGVSYVLLDDYNVDTVLQQMKYGMVIDGGYDEYTEETYY